LVEIVSFRGVCPVFCPLLALFSNNPHQNQQKGGQMTAEAEYVCGFCRRQQITSFEKNTNDFFFKYNYAVCLTPINLGFHILKEES
jgi:hypothetical protein